MKINQECSLRYTKQCHKMTARKSTVFKVCVQNGAHKDHRTSDIYATRMEAFSLTILALSAQLATQ